MNTAYWIFFGLFLLSLAVRDGYELLKKSGRLDPKNKMIFGVVFTAMAVLWTSWFSMGTMDPLRVALPAILRWTGLGLVLAGLVLGITALIQLRGLENIDHLVTTGFFSRLRHPMYTGFILWIFGWPLFHGAALTLVVGLAGLASILYWRKLEDDHLSQSFGEAYRQYRSRTWF